MDTAGVVEKLRRAYSAWHDTRGASVAAWVELMAEDVQVRSVADGAPGMEFSAPRTGREAARAYFSALAADWEMIYCHTDEVLVDGERVVVFGRCEWRYRPTGKSVASPLIHRWRFRDGLATECFEFYDTAKALAATVPDQT